ncbi:MAG: hypothetical protein R3F39_13350 [Myxococcota bacterium]
MNPMYRAGALVAAGAFIVGLTLVAEAKIIAPSKYRKVVDGVGSCVFSTDEVPFKKEDSYKVQTEFSGDDEIHLRCYFAKQLVDYRDQGKISSQLRGMEGGNPSISTRLQFAPPRWQYRGNIKVTEAALDWDQMRADLVRSGDCNYRKEPKEGSPCINIAEEVRNLVRDEGHSLPYTTEICVHFEFDVVEEKIPNPKNVLEMIDKKSFVTLAKGCFKYTLKE